MNPVTIEAAIQIIAQVATLVQQAIASGKTTIDAATFNAAVSTRDAALQKLDADIAAQKGPSTP